jgi:hypothetical protein
MVLLVVLNSLCVSNESSGSEKSDYKPSFEDIDKLYLSNGPYLLPEPPDKDPKNKTTLQPGDILYQGHNLRDRKYNPDLKPSLDLWLDTHGQKGLVLQFEIGFQAWEENTLIDGEVYRIVFNNYTTIGAAGGENAIVTFREYVNEPFDIKYGADNYASIYLMINFTENASASSIDIYSGASGKISLIKLPFDQTLSWYESEQKKKDDNDNSPGFTGGVLIISAVVLIIIFSIKYRPERSSFRRKK